MCDTCDSLNRDCIRAEIEGDYVKERVMRRLRQNHEREAHADRLETWVQVLWCRPWFVIKVRQPWQEKVR